jgi:hypothetical protein
MIYKFVTTPTEARNDLVSFYEDILCDEIEDKYNTEHELTTPEAYLADVRNEAKDQTDDFGHDIEKHILKACEQSSTFKKLAEYYNEAKHLPAAFVAIRK